MTPLEGHRSQKCGGHWSRCGILWEDHSFYELRTACDHKPDDIL